MVVFLAASDESRGGDETTGVFISGGFVAPKETWDKWFGEAWQERVLDGPPAIPYLHMTEIRRDKWRAKHKLSEFAAEQRVDEAFRVFRSTGRLHPVASQLDQGNQRTAFAEIKLKGRTGRSDMHPDYFAFLMYAHHVLGWVADEYPEATRVDFMYEKSKKEVMKMLKEFHAGLLESLTTNGLGHMARLVGDLVFGEKTDVPLQAADVLCWHERRRVARMLSYTDAKRYGVFARMNGRRHLWPDEEIRDFAARAKENGEPE